MKRLFNNRSHVNEAGAELHIECKKKLDPLLAKWVEAGYCPRDIEWIIAHQMSLALALLNVAKQAKLA